jgi:alpha-mannosidase
MLISTKIIPKLETIAKNYDKLRFETIEELPVEIVETSEHLKSEPASGWQPINAGTNWGGSWITAWFRSDFTVPKVAKGRRLFLNARVQGEAALFINGNACGVFDVNHHFVSLTPKAKVGERFHVALEAYSGHDFPHVDPHSEPVVIKDKSRTFDGLLLAAEREDVSAFVFDLRVLMSLAKALDENSLRKHKLMAGLQDVWSAVNAMPQELEEQEWRPRLAVARKIMKPLLQSKNGPTAPSIAILAHSHIDTAWLWTVAETRRKCTRTFSSMVNLMERYPEVIFIQSAPVHLQMVKEDHPELYQQIRKLVRDGRWEPNGGAWVEPDCNLTAGESLVRTFLFGIQWTREHFGYSPDMFWQPDVFGYTGSLPQILRGVGIKYFCTTKMGWNDTTRFPYDTFQWQGVDGSRVLAHLNHIHYEVEPHELISRWNWSQHKDQETKRLAAYGWGDGGGGPTMETMELARRVEDLEGCPRTYYTTVSDFMQELDRERRDWPTFVGELYLEAHRGTLTSIAEIKRANRKTEIRLRDAEALSTAAACDGVAYPAGELRALWGELLVNHFHDILPGSSIREVNDEAIESYRGLLQRADALALKAAGHFAPEASAGSQRLMLFNTLGWDREGTIELEDPGKELQPAGEAIRCQPVVDVAGRRRLIVHGHRIPAMGAAVLELSKISKVRAGSSPFKQLKNGLETPFARVRFDKLGRISSYVLKSTNRELVHGSGALNTFHCGEDVPQAWDSWDIDSDQEQRMQPEERMVKRDVVADGPLQLRIRSEWRIGRKSTLIQDMIFHADSPMMSFETVVDWHEKHMLLKAGFDLNVMATHARHEMQFCHVERPTHRNYPKDRAQFEVPCQKWSDLSDEGFGIAILNDCKYGISTNAHDVRLTLLKSGTHPDERGDEGRHEFKYALLPHEGGFSVRNVVLPAYEFNVPVTSIRTGAAAIPPRPLFRFDSESVVVETVKWAEEQKAFVIRLYEAGRRRSQVTVEFDERVKRVEHTNLLEETHEALPLKEGRVSFYMTPFQIATLLCHL